MVRDSLRTLIAVAVVAGFALVAHAQSALDGFDPNANGDIEVVVVQPDGKTLIGGFFTSLAPNGGPSIVRNGLARLNPDGTLDTGFDPNVQSGGVISIVVQADGKIVVGGLFGSVGGQPRNNIARVDGTTGAVDSFDPNANDYVRAIALEADGKILAGGAFTTIGGQSRFHIARLDPATGLAESFDPFADAIVLSIVVQADGKILVGGDFGFIGGQSRNCMARLDPVTSFADTFNPSADGSVRKIAMQADGKVLAGGWFRNIGGQARNYIARLNPTTGLADSFNPNTNVGGLMDTIAVQADGKILAGGHFTSIGGQMRNRIARLDPVSGLADAFDPNANSTVFTIAVQRDGKILAAGNFSSLSSNGGSAVTRNRIARLYSDGFLDATANPDAGGSVSALAIQPDGKILVGGSFLTIGGQSRNGMARLNFDGTVDLTFNAMLMGGPGAIAVQADGRILIGGSFTTVAGQTRNRIARLNQDGTLDATFDPNANGTIHTIAMQPDGRIIVGGFYSSIGGQTRNNIARLNFDGTLDTGFNPNTATGSVRSVSIQSDQKILIGGTFSSVAGQTRNRIARLNSDGSLDPGFDPNVTQISSNGAVYSIVTQPDGRIVIGGFFSLAGGQTRYNIARLNENGTVDTSFSGSANGSGVLTLLILTDGKILAAGGFTEVSGQTRNGIARLKADGTLDSNFNPVPMPDGGISAMAVQSDGKVWLAGGFQFFGGLNRNRIARLSSNTSAFQDLSVTRTTVNWLLYGSTPRFDRATFELSTDGINYTSLGAGNQVFGAPHWTLTGLALPTEQNLWIRGRGYYRGGQHGGSESLLESVRNVFINGMEPSPTSTATLTPTYTPTNSPTATPTASGTPMLGDYGDITVSLSGNATVMPKSIPHGASILSASTSTMFQGGLSIEPTTGTVNIVNARPAGNYLVTVKAQNSFGSVTKIFTLSVSTVPACNELAFITPLNRVSTGNNPQKVAVGDFNRDGIQDLAVARASGPSVVVLLGTGFGGFNLSTTLFPAIGPNFIAVGDFNNDGMQDLVTTNANANSISVFLGTGAGSFASGVNIAVGGSFPTSVSIGDFNGDGFEDLAVANRSSTNVRVMFGTGSVGLFSLGPVTTLASGGIPFGMTLGDFNGDGHSDLAVASQGGSLSVFLAAENGAFGGETIVGPPALGARDVTVGDFNGDGVQDLATANTPSSSVSVFLGTGTGTFGAAINYNGLNEQPHTLAVGNFNTDGQQDLVVANTNSNITFLLGTGDGTFGSRMNFGEDMPTSVAIGDFNGDGLQDIVVPNASPSSNYLSVYIRLCRTVSGTVTYGNAAAGPTPRFVSNVQISGSGSPAVSTTSGAAGPNAGNYYLTGFGAGAYTVTPGKTGGVNGAISSFDAGRIAQHAAGTNILTGNQLIVADVSGNGTVSSFDAGQVARYAAGISGSGSTGNWIFVPANKSYASVNSNVSGQDFLALLMGEVSGNWTNTGAARGSLTAPRH